MSSDFKFKCALAFAKASDQIVKRIAPGRGTALPGKVALKIDPQFITHFSGIEPNHVIFVTGTNGKSTTVNLIVSIMQEAAISVASNLEGANMLSGVATTLIENSDEDGHFNKDYLVLETDERFLPLINKQLKPHILCVTNIQKDQVQRNGEPDIIYQKIKSVIAEDTIVVLNNEDPLSKYLGHFSKNAYYYSVQMKNNPKVINHHSDMVTLPCPECGYPIVYDTYNVSHIGTFHCNHCGYKSSKKPDGLLISDQKKPKVFSFNNKSADGFVEDWGEYTCPYPADYFLYGYSAALTLADFIDTSNRDQLKACSKRAIEKFQNVDGRFENLLIRDKQVHYLRIKQENPETLQNAIDYIVKDKEDKAVVFWLSAITDFEPYYTNTFYTFDCDFEALVNSNVKEYLCCSKTVGPDTTNRLIYAGAKSIKNLYTDEPEKIANAISQFDTKNVYLITILANYNKLQKVLNKEGKR